MKQTVIRMVLPAVVAWGVCAAAAAQQTVTGAGASFPAPLYSQTTRNCRSACG